MIYLPEDLIYLILALNSCRTELRPTSVSICTTDRMSGEALFSKCFIMPKVSSDRTKKTFFMAD